MRTIGFTLFFALAAACAAQGPATAPLAADHPGAVHPWTSLEVEPSAGEFQFAIVSDRAGGVRPGVFEKAVEKLNLLQPQFVMSVGDLIEGYTDKPESAAAMRDEFDAIVAKLQMPFFYVAGNHDVQEPECLAEWQRRFGRPYYSFVYRDVLFLCLDSVHLDESQAQWALQTLNDHAQARWTILFMHYPLWTSQVEWRDETELRAQWAKIETALAGRPHTVFAGHYHEYTRYQRHGSNYYILATTGGASSAKQWESDPTFGEFDHIVWVTMADEGPRVANVLLDGVQSDDVVTEESAKTAFEIRTGIDQSGLSAPAIFIKSARFREGAIEATAQNASPLPMQVSLTFEPHPQLQVSPNVADLQVAPRSNQQLALTVNAQTPVEPSVAPLVMNVTSTFTTPDGREFTRRSIQRVAIVRREIKPCGRAGQPVKVDGRLDDWDGLPLVVEQPVQILGNAKAWTGPEDCSYRFGVSFDLNHLYVAVQTTDGNVINDKGDQPWQQDGVEIRLDARPDPQRSMGKGHLDFDQTLLAALVPVERGQPQRGYRLSELPEGTQVVCVKTDDGYVTELAIPLAYLNKTQGSDWSMFRLDVAVNDLDEDDGEPAQLHWVPDWRTPENYPGSGTFQRVNP